MNKIDKSILSYLSTTANFSDVDLRIEEHHGSKYLIVYVDVEKLDRNHPNYDEQYADKITDDKRRQSHPIPGLVSSTSTINSLIRQAEKFFGEENTDYKPAFLPKNYKHLDVIEKEIDAATKKIDPKIDVRIEWDSDSPKPILKFYTKGSVNKKDYMDKPFAVQDLLKNIQKELGDNIKIKAYKWSVTGTSPKD